jgi:hypothetical protein
MYVRTQRGRLGQVIDPTGGYLISNADAVAAAMPTVGGQSILDLGVNAVDPNADTSAVLGLEQIQSVVANCNSANAAAVAAGQSAPYNCAALQTTANAQATAFLGENASLWNYGAVGLAAWPWYYWLAIAAGAIWVYGELK